MGRYQASTQRHFYLTRQHSQLAVLGHLLMHGKGMADLPKDALYQIFSRLPIASLARFRCVCKLWCNYIDDPYLASIHVKEPAIPMMLNGQYAKQLGLVRITESKERFELKQDSINYRFPSKGWKVLNIGVCNGMILLSYVGINTNRLDFLVIHPLRKERYEFPYIEIYESHHPKAYGLGFDDSTNTFKVVCLFQRNQETSLLTSPTMDKLCTMVHVLGTNLWRKIPQIPDFSQMNNSQGLSVHGLLYWLTFRDQGSVRYVHKVIYFDVTKEEFGSIDPPPKPTIISTSRTTQLTNNVDHLVNIHDKLGYVYEINDGIKVYVLKHEEWVLYCHVHGNPPIRGVSFCYNEDGDLLFREMRLGVTSGLFIYKLKTGDLHKLNILRDAIFRSTYSQTENWGFLLYQTHLSSSIRAFL